MMYLENVLETLSNNADVLVELSSIYAVKLDRYDPMDIAEMRDHCGNHEASSWKDAIDFMDAYNTFWVDFIKSEISGDRVQYTIRLHNTRSELSDKLRYLSNRISLAKVLGEETY